jgi:hypothetical protein
MKTIYGIKVVAGLLAAGLICGGCNKEGAPSSAANTNESPAAPPKVETQTAVALTNGGTSAITNMASTPVLSPEEAKAHVSEVATVRGQVFGVHETAKGDVFINIGGVFPNAPFTAVCFQGAIPAEDLKKLLNKTVSIKGKIKDHNGQIEIILDSADQIGE